MSAKRNRGEQRRKREEKLSVYKQYLLNKLSEGVDVSGWLAIGDSYERGLKLLAEREVYKLLKREEVRQNGA